jgi:hypothetical protein
MVQSVGAARRGVGRVGAKESFWREHLGLQPRSGLSIRAYCARHSLSQPSFYAWRSELARRDAERAQRPAFVPVIVGAGASEPTVEFQLPSGLIIRVPAHDREALGAVWELVKVPSCSA